LEVIRTKKITFLFLLFTLVFSTSLLACDDCGYHNKLTVEGDVLVREFHFFDVTTEEEIESILNEQLDQLYYEIEQHNILCIFGCNFRATSTFNTFHGFYGRPCGELNACRTLETTTWPCTRCGALDPRFPPSSPDHFPVTCV